MYLTVSKIIMNFFFKQTTETDLPFYTECFQNKEFQYMLYGNSPLKLCQLANYTAKNNKDYKFVFSSENEGVMVTLGFTHFYYKIDNQYIYIGGIHPDYFNSGLGVSASIAALSLFYDFNGQASFETGIYKHNLRSLRLHLAIGFVITEESKEKYILSLDKEGFNNKFVFNVKKRIKYQLITEG